MIIQTGMRTDIPAFYSRWFLNRLAAGFVLTRNPYNPSSVTRYRLSPDVVDAIGFCTKNPEPMLPHLDALRPYGQYWFVTLTPYGRDIEPNVPPKAKVIESFRKLSEALGPRRVGWRYDPILINAEWTVERHIEAFSALTEALDGATESCVISFIDLYPKLRRTFPEARTVGPEDRLAIARAFPEIAARHGMVVKGCAEGRDMEPFGVDCSGCVTAATWERALGQRLRVPAQKPLREGCACVPGNDIGAYNTCGHLCRYCYANQDADSVRRNMRAHDPQSPFLIGRGTPDDVIHDAVQRSWIDGQISMFP